MRTRLRTPRSPASSAMRGSIASVLPTAMLLLFVSSATAYAPVLDVVNARGGDVRLPAPFFAAQQPQRPRPKRARVGKPKAVLQQKPGVGACRSRRSRRSHCHESPPLPHRPLCRASSTLVSSAARRSCHQGRAPAARPARHRLCRIPRMAAAFEEQRMKARRGRERIT